VRAGVRGRRTFQLVGGGLRPSKVHSSSPNNKRRGEGVHFHLVKVVLGWLFWQSEATSQRSKWR
jgi:hypothetical protein